ITPFPTPPGFVGPAPPAISSFTATTVAMALTPGTQQYWRPGVTDGMSDARLDGIVLHELLHNLGFSDVDIQLSLGGPGMVSNVTDNISQRLTNDCFSGVL